LESLSGAKAIPSLAPFLSMELWKA